MFWGFVHKISDNIKVLYLLHSLSYLWVIYLYYVVSTKLHTNNNQWTKIGWKCKEILEKIFASKVLLLEAKWYLQFLVLLILCKYLRERERNRKSLFMMLESNLQKMFTSHLLLQLWFSVVHFCDGLLFVFRMMVGNLSGWCRN
jgi:hypothetical protein